MLLVRFLVFILINMKNKYVKTILIIISLSFLCSYVVSMSGYYEQMLSNKTMITNQKIKEFEEAVNNDENIDEFEFFSDIEVDYTNKFSNTIYRISDNGNKIARKYLKKIFSMVNSFMLEE